MNMEDDGDISRVAFSKLQAKEEEIERKKMDVRGKVELQLGQSKEQIRRLAYVWEELEELVDALGKEVATVRKKIDITTRELKPLGLCCQKMEKYKEATKAFNEKSKEKAQLSATLMELLAKSERLRMQKLADLSKCMESVR
ncbi:uncharacterized protein LOC116187735 [Punica granatum]|uniref:Uncharacterized protein LOC116187735 n=2 Tax=Punica granatum TaxID=22663 RepID=A0A6P8BRX6_PUNGR|nr:uncharacterized protein LOC116187735 [Punica granatum]PKI63696.1 hypothetical protein CRG98_015886 [Punica granatum]